MQNNDLVPNGWLKCEFQDVVHSFKRGPFGSAIKKDFFVPSGYKVYEQKNAIYDDPSLGDYYITREKYEDLKKFSVKGGDFIVSCSGTIGRISQLPATYQEGVINQALLRIRINPKLLDFKYFLNLFRSEVFQRKVLVETKGSAMKNIAGVKDLKPIPVLLPPLNEQRRIVAKIEALFSELEAGVAALETAASQLKTYRQSLLKHAFEGKLTAEWRAENQDRLETAESLLQRIKAERQARYEAETAEWEANGRNGRKPQPPKALPPLTERETAELPELPDGWGWVKTGEMADLITKGASPKWQGFDYVDDPNQVLFITSENVRENHLNISHPKYLQQEFNQKQVNSILQKGDVLLNIVGASIGRAAVYNLEANANINQAVSLIRISDTAISKVLLSLLLNSNFARSYYSSKKVDVARANLSLEDVSNIPFPLCSLKEQLLITNKLESDLSAVDQLEQTITAALQQAEALRQSILKKAFAGQLVPQDPNDEPAAALLARIRAGTT